VVKVRWNAAKLRSATSHFGKIQFHHLELGFRLVLRQNLSIYFVYETLHQNPLYLLQNVLKLAYSKVEIQKRSNDKAYVGIRGCSPQNV